MRISDWSSDVCSSDLLDAVGADVADHQFHLLADERRRHLVDAEHALGVLRGQRGNGGHGVAAEGGYRLDVGLAAGAAAGIRAGPDPDPPGDPPAPRPVLVHSAPRPEKRRVWKEGFAP